MSRTIEHVVLISDAELGGGAAVATTGLAQGLLSRGVRVTRIVHRRQGGPHAWTTRSLRSLADGRLARTAQRVAVRVGYSAAAALSHVSVAKPLERLLKELEPDAIVLNNLHGAGWMPELARICTARAPTVWTLHDMWSFTGRCAYNGGFERFLAGCDAECPTPRQYPPLRPELIASAWRSRRELLARSPSLVAVAPSRWLAAEASRGLWRDHRVETIPYGIDLGCFEPIHKEKARAELGLAQKSPVLLCAAFDFRDERKGARLLRGALHEIDPDVTILAMGAGSLQVPSGVRVEALGYIEDPAIKALAYSAADATLHPALADNLPLTIIESFACGTPVVGLPVGGVVDLVREGQTGWLAQAPTAEALQQALHRCVQDVRSSRDLRQSCRRTAEHEYGMGLQADRYLALLSSMRPDSATKA